MSQAILARKNLQRQNCEALKNQIFLYQTKQKTTVTLSRTVVF